MLPKEYTAELAQKLMAAVSGVQIDFKASKKTYRMVISQESVDRDGEMIMLSGANTEYYLKSPVVLIDHSYKVESIVGKTVKLAIVGNEMIADFIFADTETGQLAEKLYIDGFLKASSIGFICKKRQPDNYRMIMERELLEWSLVAVGSNRGALSLDGKEFDLAVQKGLVKEIKEGEEQEDEDPTKPHEVTPNEVTELQVLGEQVRTLTDELSEVKTLLQTLVDDKTEKSKVYELKEMAQSLSRAVNDFCRELKQ